MDERHSNENVKIFMKPKQWIVCAACGGVHGDVLGRLATDSANQAVLLTERKYPAF